MCRDSTCTWSIRRRAPTLYIGCRVILLGIARVDGGRGGRMRIVVRIRTWSEIARPRAGRSAPRICPTSTVAAVSARVCGGILVYNRSIDDGVTARPLACSNSAARVGCSCAISVVRRSTSCQARQRRAPRPAIVSPRDVVVGRRASSCFRWEVPIAGKESVLWCLCH